MKAGGYRPGKRLAILIALSCIVGVPASIRIGQPEPPGRAKAAGVPSDMACPSGAVRVSPGMSIQAEVDRHLPGSQFCIETGTHRLQSVIPKEGQQFIGEPGAILSGARVLDGFVRQEGYWVASGAIRLREKSGTCAPGHSLCQNTPGIFLDGEPLDRLASKGDLRAGGFYLDEAAGSIFLADDPNGRIVEAATARHAFDGSAPNVVIRGLVVEKYDNAAQTGAINARNAKSWRVEFTEVRYNSGGGIAITSGGQVRYCNVHHNGQIGIVGTGSNILIEGNLIWTNNTSGFDSGWEAGGAKISLGNEPIFRANTVRRNGGAGLWCDINCRNAVFEKNKIDNNDGPGIFFEISDKAKIRNNQLSFNGLADNTWFWGAEVQVAGSQNVEIWGNDLTVGDGGRAIVLIDQGRTDDDGHIHATRDNHIHGNDITFTGDGATGGASDVRRGAPNFHVIERGNNVFDGDTYRSNGHSRVDFVWGHASGDFAWFRTMKQEPHGSMLTVPDP